MLFSSWLHRDELIFSRSMLKAWASNGISDTNWSQDFAQMPLVLNYEVSVQKRECMPSVPEER
jgi:hypothetical protein